MCNYQKNKRIEIEYSTIHGKSRNLYNMISIYIFKHDRQTDGPSKLHTGCLLVQGILALSHTSHLALPTGRQTKLIVSRYATKKRT